MSEEQHSTPQEQGDHTAQPPDSGGAAEGRSGNADPAGSSHHAPPQSPDNPQPKRPHANPYPPVSYPDDGSSSYGHVDDDGAGEQEIEVFASTDQPTDTDGNEPPSPFSNPLALMCFVLFGFVFGLIAFFVVWFIVRKEPSRTKSRALFFTAMGWIVSAIISMALLASFGDTILPTGNMGSPLGSTGNGTSSAW